MSNFSAVSWQEQVIFNVMIMTVLDQHA